MSSQWDPADRLRRMRADPVLRAMVREHRISPEQLMYPIFVTESANSPEPIGAMPGQYRWPLTRLFELMDRLVSAGIRSVLLFGIPATTDGHGEDAAHPDGVVSRAVRLIRNGWPEMVVCTDVCLCAYSAHGHCGVYVDGVLDNDRTLPLLAAMAVAHAEAGAHLVAPSAMADGQVAAIRTALDSAGFANTAIMAYSAKYASGFYGPFREAAGSAPHSGDRKAYQMDPPNALEALREMEADARQGADILMVKPGLAYLDIVVRARQRFPHPVAVYQVSGEYAMIEAAAANGWLDRRAVVMEVLTASVRAGAQILITYHAPDVARWLGE